MPSVSNSRKLGPYSRPAALSKIDGRTREARFCKQLRADLTVHVGGTPSVTQAALIDLAVSVALQIELMQQHRTETGVLTPHDHRTFLAWGNTLRRTLAQLGMRGAAESPQTLSAYLAGRGAAQ